MKRLLLVLCIGSAAAPAMAELARGLDHDRHQLAAKSKNVEVNCQSCHKLTSAGLLAGKPDHTWCFGACHEAPAKRTGRKPYAISAAQRPLCEVCHGAGQLTIAATKGSVALAGALQFPAPEHSISMSHAAHQDPSKKSCVSCHRFKTRPRAHARCASCHRRDPASAAVKMDQCERCHQKRDVDTTTPFAVGERYSHSRHAPRVGVDCARCHPNAASATQMNLARPSKTSCTACHNGKEAFSTQASSCRKCHPTPSALETSVRAPEVALTHSSHSQLPCSQCHDESGSFRAKAGHALCSSFECHSTELSIRKPTICSSCHVGSEPWLAQHVDSPRRAVSDFGVRFEHRKHPAPTDSKAACKGCHTGDPNRPDAGLTTAHAACVGTGCHAGPSSVAPTTETASPALGDCAGCHEPGRRLARRVAARARSWSVAARFGHAKHSDAACVDCHSLTAAPPAGRDLAPPAKSTCASCHDGEKAFKLTGHACKRCHEK